MMTKSVSDGGGRDRIWEQNSSVPLGVDGRMDVTISRVVAAQPDAPAVCAWDGDLSYRELDELASRLAVRLQSLGTGPGDIVPLCFEKSQWTVVSVVAVVKTGAAFLLLDPLLPTDRLRVIIQQCESSLMLTSLSHGAMGEQLRLPVTVVTVGHSLRQEPPSPRPGSSSLDKHPKLKPPTLRPESLLYVVFTSGSTGMPKGCMLSHGNLCSAMHYQNKSLGFRPASRVFDFASYSFDVAVHNLFATLTTGACLCIPSDADRRDGLEGSMARMGATLANLTPTVARLLNPDALPALETLLLLGEQVTDLETTLWCGKAQVVNSYGPAECTPISTANCAASTVAGLRHSGRGIGSVAWIVDPADHDVLLPWGETGELLIEGPIVGQGYLHDPKKTADVFVRDPAWLVRGGPGVRVPGRTGRLYKTGDLAHYDADGNVVVTGRKDTQVKIRGNRIELGEVEHHVSACMPDVTRVVAEAILPAGAGAGHLLAVFLQTDDDQTDGKIRLVHVEDEVASGLARHLPPYMIPTLFFAMPQIPLTLTGKTNRKLLREMGSSFSMDRIASASHTGGRERARRAPPRTETERTLHTLWARVLGIDGDSIGLDDNLFRLGADSITAMKLVAEARKVDVPISVADIFRHPVLSGLAVLAASAKPRSETDRNGVEDRHQPSTSGALDVISPGELHHRGALGPEDIMEILPLSDMQESLAVEGLSDALQLVDYFYLDLPPAIDLAKLEHSCRDLLEAFPVLRACFLPCAEKHWMVIPRTVDLIFRIIEAESESESESESDPDTALAKFCLDDIATFGRHQTIVGFFVLREAGSANRLVLRISHAQYDGISIGVIFNALILSYRGTPIAPEPTSLADYMAHVARTRDSAVTYWRGVLEGSSTSPAGTCHEKDGLRVRPGAPQGVGAQSFRVERQVATPRPLAGITPASYMSAAWAVFLSRLQDGDGEVVFGRLVSGRNAAMPGLETTVGCCVNVVPVRVDTGSASIGEVASAVQEQFVSMGDADSLGFKEVAENCGADFFSCTQHQNVGDEVSLAVEEGFASTLRRFENPRRLPYFLYVISFPRGEKTALQIFAHTGMLSVERAEELLETFCLFVEGL